MRRLKIATAMAACLVVGAFGAPTATSAPLVPPNAVLDVDPNPALVGQTVAFDGSGSSGDGLGGTIAKYEWDVDGIAGYELDTGTTPTTSRSYGGPATFSVGLRVTDSDGDTDEDTVSLRIHQAPVAGFIFEPSTPGVGEQVTFSSTSSDPDGPLPAGAEKWDFDNDGLFDDAVGDSATHSFASPGTKPVALEVTDADGAKTVVSRNVLVQSDPPNAAFTFSPTAPLSKETVFFDGSGSTAPAGESIAAMSWDLDGDGSFDDATGPTASFSYATPGPRTVQLRVDSSGGAFDITSQVLNVGNRIPIASFTFSPKPPQAGDVVELVSTSADPDGPIVDQAWDLNGDGSFDDATGATAQRTFTSAGIFTVGIRVRDGNGGSNEATQTIEVGSPQLELMSPFPIVRLAGEVRPSGKTLVEKLTVHAPKESDVTVRCLDNSCSFRERRRTVWFGLIRFHGFNDALDPGTRIEIFVTDPNEIGKYTSFKLRKAKAPKRRDRCLEGELQDPVRCPDAEATRHERTS